MKPHSRGGEGENESAGKDVASHSGMSIPNMANALLMRIPMFSVSDITIA